MISNNKLQRQTSSAVIIPCYNEALTIGPTIDEYRQAFPSAGIYVCDNRSTDDTASIARQHGAKVIFEPRQGKGYAVRRLFAEVNADFMVLTDGDLTYPAIDAQRLFSVIQSEDADMVVGDRHSDGAYRRGKTRPFHSFGNGLISRLIKWLFGTSVRDPSSGLRVFRADFAKTVPLMARGFEVEAELTVQCLDKDYRLIEVPIGYRDRPSDSHSKLRTLRDGLSVVFSCFQFAVYFRPMVLLSLCALGSLACAVFLGVAPVLEFIEHQYVYKVPSLIVASSLLVLAVLLFLMGVMLEALRYVRAENFRLLKNQKLQ